MAVPPETRQLLASQITSALRAAIVDAEYGLGASLSEERIAASFGVSRTPVREALAALQIEGLIIIRPQRGSFVFMPSAADVHELCEFRMMVESRALVLSLTRNRERTLLALRAAQAAMEDAGARGDTKAACDADGAFHTALFAGCMNGLLEQAYFMVAGRIGAIRSNIIGPDKAIRTKSIHEHRRVIQAFSDGDVLRAETVLAEHVFGMRENYAKLLEDTRESPAS